MDNFVKKTSSGLSGSEKAAILLAELGPVFNDNYSALEAALHLSDEEKVKLAKVMKNLGTYNPVHHGMGEIKREEAVLNEVINFGKKRGIFHPVKKSDMRQLGRTDLTNDVSQMAKNDPESVAKILSSWLGDEDK